MSKRLKYAKLRLAKPAGDAVAVLGVADAGAALAAAEERMTDCIKADEGENNLRSCKRSKFFTNECSSQDTFIEIEDEQTEDQTNEVASVPSSRRRTQKEPDMCPSTGPKMPKLRKKTSKGNVLISTFLNNHTAEDDDFEDTRTSTGSQPKETKVQRAAKKPKAPRKPKNQSDIRKLFKKYKTDYEVLHQLIKDHSTSEKIDPEELQMALALSRSLVDRECGEGATSSTEVHQKSQSSSVSSEERRIVGIRTTLEQFGFRCKNSYTDYDLNVIFGAGCKNVKKIKHKRPTNLQRRTREELSDFIDQRASNLFPAEIMAAGTGASCAEMSMANVQSYLSHLFWIAQTDEASHNLMDKYYVPELLEADPAPVGCLLKDWSKIPGRETTPEREDCAIETDMKDPVPDDAALQLLDRSTSPDLFDEFEDLAIAENRIESNVCDNVCAIDRTSPVDQIEKVKMKSNRENRSEKSFEYMLADETLDAATNKDQVEDKRRHSSSFDCHHTARESRDPGIEKVIVVDGYPERRLDGEHSSPTEQPSAEVPVLDLSSENIFDETDPEPLVSYEHFSSEEEKISAPVRQEATSPEGDMIDQPDQVASAPTLAEQFSKPDGLLQQPLNAEHGRQEATQNSIEEPSTMQRSEDKQELSFHRIAIKARLSEALQNSSYIVETVDLIDDTESVKGTNQIEAVNLDCQEMSQCSSFGGTQDDVLCISDDEVNYSIMRFPADRSHPTEKVNAPAEEDLDRTVPYYTRETVETQADESNPAVSIHGSGSEPGSNHGAESEIMSASLGNNNDDSCAAEPAVDCAESTFSYLISLVKKFNLPPLRCEQSESRKVVDPSKPHSQPNKVNSIPDAPEPNWVASDGQESPVRNRQDVKASKTVAQNRTSLVSDGLADYLENYAAPDFDEKDLEAEMVASQAPSPDQHKRLQPEPSTSGWSRVKSCTQLTSPKNTPILLKRVVSEASISCSTPKEETPSTVDQFSCKFHDVMRAGIAVPTPEYLIQTENVALRPPCYEDMSALDIDRELFKYGLKALKRSKAIQVLHHLFEETHPFVEVKQTMGNADEQHPGLNNIPTSRDSDIVQITRQNALRPRVCAFRFDPDVVDWFLPSKPRKKIAWCPVPLHIAFFNLVSESAALQRQILLYEPVNLDDIYSVLKGVGLRYETNDLIAFLDKQCITFRSASSGGSRTKAKAKDDIQ